jgi:hypothetical protein
VLSWTSIYYQPLPGYPLPTFAARYKPSGEWETTGQEEFDSVHDNCRHTIHNKAGPWYAVAREDNGRLIAEPQLNVTPITGCGTAQVNMGAHDTTTDLGPIKTWADNPHATTTRTIHHLYKGGIGECGNPNISSCEAEFTGKLNVSEYTGPPPGTPPPLPPVPDLPPMQAAPAAGNPCPRIITASFAGSPANPSVIVHGRCLGSRPAPNPAGHPAGLGGCPAMNDDGYDYGTNVYLAVPAQGWSGGRYQPTLNEIDCIDLVVTKFTPTEVDFHFGPFYKSAYPKFALSPGNQVEVGVNGATYDTTVTYG